MGVLATWSPVDCLRKWEPTAAFLSQAVPEARFVIQPLTYEQILPAVERGEIDFLVANPALYAACEQTHHATRVATRIESFQGRPAKTYGGAVICRAARDDLQSLEDLRGKTLMAVHPWSFGGWLMAQRKLNELGIRTDRGLEAVHFADRQDAVVEAVLQGRVDAGTLCAGDLEQMISSGRVQASALRVLRARSDDQRDNVDMRSTRVYPQWAFAKLRHTSHELAKRVAEALFQMAADSDAARAAGTAGWTIPLAYEPVHECLRELRVGPYEHFGEVTAAAAIRAYWPWLVAAGLLAVVGWAATGTILWLNRRLRESEGLRREAERFAASGRMAAHVAHEINNPMAGIVNCLHLVKGTLHADHPAERYVAAAEREATRITRIVRQMLALHRCRPEKAGLFHVGSSIEDVALMLQPVARQRNVRIETRVEGGEKDCVRLPEESLRQVLFNLLTNAIEASSPGDVVRVDAERDGSQLRIAVSDTGAGIPKEVLDRVFEPFYSTKTEPGAGLGLGLPISRGIIESLGGTMTLESWVGKGTCCRIGLPLQADSFRLDGGQPVERVLGRLGFSDAVPAGRREKCGRV
ncbi:MAG: sensor histidine kinase [Planctomycetaceae bacterium]|nr:sensor histidine kinase [Planctomycetaceae bacterium]